MNSKCLILFTDYFPFEKWEPYVKNEIPFLSKAFPHIYILCSCTASNQPAYSLPDNVSVIKLDTEITFSDKVLSLKQVFSSLFFQEWRFIKDNLRIRFNLSRIKILLSTLASTSKIKKNLGRILHEQKLAFPEILLYSFWTDARAIACAQLRKEKNCKAISRCHGWDVYFERHKSGYLPLRKFLHENLNAQFFVSEHGRNYSQQKISGSPTMKYKLAYLGTNFKARNPDSYSKEFVLVTCSRLIALKRIHLVIEILNHIQFPVRWIHFGDGPLREEIFSFAKQLPNHIAFDYRGDVENDDLLTFYSENHIDLFLITSETEGMPMVLMEALSFGIPVMATDVGGISEVINEGNGFLLDKNFSPRQASEIISQFHGLTVEDKLLKRENAYKMWKQKFNAEIVYPGFIQEILDLK
jgi:glycosyltransferase involved in cell wall biosynthesis